jgi:hypothetical protein
MVKRYGQERINGETLMLSKDEGQYVLYTDYEKLETGCARMPKIRLAKAVELEEKINSVFERQENGRGYYFDQDKLIDTLKDIVSMIEAIEIKKTS